MCAHVVFVALHVIYHAHKSRFVGRQALDPQGELEAKADGLGFGQGLAGS